jgi:hypothetical protein
MDNTGSEAKATEMRDEARAPIDEAKQRLRALNERAKSYIKEHPAACLMGALALGYVVARFARRRS